jgi:GDP-L-fucose synthase
VFDASKVPLINIGAGKDLSIRELAEVVAAVVGYRGQFVQDASKPDGTPRKLLDTSRMRALGWEAKIELREGLAEAYRDFLARSV